MSNKNKFFFVFLLFCFAFGFAHVSQAGVYSSQCQTGQTGGDQSGCTHDNDQAILDNQCKMYASAYYCDSMQSYLDYMMTECARLEANGTKTGVDCTKISWQGYYGREAAAYAGYVANNYSTATTETASTNPTAATGTNGLLNLSSNFAGLPDPSGGIKAILENFLKWILTMIGLVAIIAFIISGLQYLLAAGDDSSMETAKKNMMYSVMGIVVALSGYIVIYAIDTALRATNSWF